MCNDLMQNALRGVAANVKPGMYSMTSSIEGLMHQINIQYQG